MHRARAPAPSRSRSTAEVLGTIREQVERYARDGLRVLALAQRDVPGEEHARAGDGRARALPSSGW